MGSVSKGVLVVCSLASESESSRWAPTFRNERETGKPEVSQNLWAPLVQAPERNNVRRIGHCGGDRFVRLVG